MTEAANRIQELEVALAQTQNSLEIEQDAFRNMQLQRDALRAKVEQLDRKVAELSKPVTAMEWSLHCNKAEDGTVLPTGGLEIFDRVIAARAALLPTATVQKP